MRAVVDIGSNSVKYVLASDQRDVPRILARGSEVTRLSRGLETTRVLSPEALHATEKALRHFKEIFSQSPEASSLQCVVLGTSAVRDCKNQEDIKSIVRSILGVELNILSGLEEARISLEGAAAAGATLFPFRQPLFVEVGGASCQLSVLEPEFFGHSFQVGAVRAHERLGYGRRALEENEISKLHSDVFSFFDQPTFHDLKIKFTNKTLRSCAIGIGGTLVLAAEAAGAKKVKDCGFVISRKSLKEFNEKLCRLNADERLSKLHLEPGREDIIATGTAVLLSVLDQFGIEDLGLSKWGLRHGALKMWDKVYPRLNL